MKLKKSRLKSIILEEIEKDLLREFESEQDRRDRWREHAKSGKPDLEEPGYADFKRAFMSIYRPAEYVTDSISGDFEYEAGEEKPESDPETVDDIMASYYLFWVKGLTKGVLSAPLGQETADMISAGYAIIMAGEGMSDTAQLFYPEYWGKDKQLPNVKDLNGNPLSGCEAVSRILVAGVIYNKIYEAYNLVIGKADKILPLRLRRMVGSRRFLAISPLLTGKDVKQILSLALTLKLLRDHQPTADAITSLSGELCNIKDPKSAYQAIENIMIKFIFGTPAFVMGVYKELLEELRDFKKSVPKDSPETDTDGAPEDDISDV